MKTPEPNKSITNVDDMDFLEAKGLLTVVLILHPTIGDIYVENFGELENMGLTQNDLNLGVEVVLRAVLEKVKKIHVFFNKNGLTK